MAIDMADYGYDYDYELTIIDDFEQDERERL